MSNTFDYIIVGAGSAGCVLANRLSTDPANNVLLIEAGCRDSNPLIHLPVGWAEIAYSEKVNWGYRIQPEPAVAERDMIWPRAKLLGGCSSTNGLVIVRGQQQDYDDWADAGNEGWSWHEVLPYFKKFEHFKGEAHPSRGSDGPMPVVPVDPSPLSEIFLNACNEAGITKRHDTNTGDQFGAAYFHVNMDKGKRQSTATTFLKPIRHRSNLTVMLECTVERINIQQGKALGVTLINKQGDSETYLASKETLISAGAINSPKLLELSGIGDKTRLENLGLPCHQHLPGVGENLQDHLGVMVCQQVSQKDTINDQFTPMKLITHLYQYVVHKKGLLNTPSSEVVAFFSSGANDTRPDCQIHFTPASGYRDNQGKSHMDKVSGVTAMVYPTRPTSRGSVHIASKKVDESPVIIANYLSTDYDRNTTLAGLAKVREIFKQASFKEINQGEIRPGKERQNDTSLLEYIAQTSTTSYHPVGTCKMGNDRMAVVDNTLKVHGIQALRIIDASIMPSICSGNTHAATLMIAEKAADMILHKT